MFLITTFGSSALAELNVTKSEVIFKAVPAVPIALTPAKDVILGWVAWVVAVLGANPAIVDTLSA